MSATIESPHNERLKELRKLHDRKNRERTGLFLAEGEDLLAEALRWGALPRTVFYDGEQLAADAPLVGELPVEVETLAVRGDALRRAGLVRVRRSGRQRLHEIDPAPLRAVEAWLKPYAAAWDVALERLRRHVEEDER